MPNRGAFRWYACLFAVVEHRTGCRLAAQRDCDFSSSGAPVEHYTGTMTRIGLDVGVTAGGAIIWAVFADTDRYTGMLSGTYAGLRASRRHSISARSVQGYLSNGIFHDPAAELAFFVKTGQNALKKKGRISSGRGRQPCTRAKDWSARSRS